MNEKPIPASQPIPEASPQPMSVPERYQTRLNPTGRNGKSHKAKPPRTKFTLVAIATLLAAAIGSGWFFGVGARSDQPTPQQIAEIERNWEVVQNIGVILPVVKQEEIAQAIAATNLPDQERIALQKEVESGRVSLAWITVWDNMAEDGDVVSLSSNGLTVTVPLDLKMQQIAIPRPSDGVVRVTGVQDGGGGITLGIMSGPDLVPIPPFFVGQSIGIPVR